MRPPPSFLLSFMKMERKAIDLIYDYDWCLPTYPFLQDQVRCSSNRIQYSIQLQKNQKEGWLSEHGIPNKKEGE